MGIGCVVTTSGFPSPSLGNVRWKEDPGNQSAQGTEVSRSVILNLWVVTLQGMGSNNPVTEFA